MKDKVICRNIKGEKIEVAPDKLVFRPSVYGVLVENGKILLSKQWNGYDFPGGGADVGETLEETVIREFFEETGLKVKVLRTIHCETSFFSPSHDLKRRDQYWNCPMIYFLVEKLGGKLSIENFDECEKEYADMPEWLDLSKMEEIKFSSSVDGLKVLKMALKISDSL